MSRAKVHQPYTVRAIHVAAGGTRRDGMAITLYFGTDGEAAEAYEDWIHAWARESTCGGAVIVEVYEGDVQINESSTTISNGPRLPFIRPSAGYPPHDCGKPMVPGHVVRRELPPGKLFCVGCMGPVLASPADRLRANTAAHAELQASRAS